MAKANVLVIEDEKIVSIDIQQSLKKLGYNVVGAGDTGEKAIELALSLRPDVILMDIMLKGDMTGIEAAAAIKKEIQVPIVYLTAYTDESTLAKAKLTEPNGYIIKPFKEVDISTTIEMALYKHKKDEEVKKERDLLYSIAEGGKSEAEHIYVKSNSRLLKISLNDVYFVEALKDYVVINTLDSRYTIHSTMKDMEAKLASEKFMRVHRSFIINLDKIAAIEQPNVILENDKKVIPIGGSYKSELSNRIHMV
ncbi:MAG: DNA-binding LytR/AlgR family response regulator [Gammaproteobacteria bacterium]|jgi:DNA-binding LytR/AlgR family response regulator